MNNYQLIKLCWQQKCCNETEFLLSKRDCLLYTVKCIICILLNFEAKKGDFDHINVATAGVYTWYSYDEGASGAIDYIAVGSSKWRYAMMSDGWP